MNGWRSFRHKWYLHPASRSEDFWSCHSINLLCNHAFFSLRLILSTEKNHLCVCRCVSQVFCEACRKTLQAGNQRPLRPCGNSDKILLLFPPLPALSFLSFSVRRGKRWGREAKQRHVCASAIVEQDPSLVCQNAGVHRFQWHSAFWHWRKWPVRGQHVVPTVTRPLGGLRKGGVEALRGLVLTLRWCEELFVLRGV